MGKDNNQTALIQLTYLLSAIVRRIREKQLDKGETHA